MTKRAYIDDPLQAAMAIRDFGFKLTFNSGEFDREIYSEVFVPSDLEALYGFFDNLNRKYYIHPDSLHLLEPQEGDLYKMPFPHSSFYIITHPDKQIVEYDGYDRGCIIQRDSKPFPQIKWEY